MTVVEQRFLPTFETIPTNAPGLVFLQDGSVQVIEADGTRTTLPGSGGGGGCAYFDCDTGTGTATIDAPVFINLDAAAQITATATAAGAALHPTVTLVTVDELGTPRVTISAHVDGDNDSPAIGEIVVGDGSGSGKYAEIRATASGPGGGLIDLNASQLMSLIAAAQIALQSQQAVIMGQPPNLGDGADVTMTVLHAGTGTTRGTFESNVSGTDDDTVQTTVLAQNSDGSGGGDTAKIVLESIEGGGGTFQMTADRLIFKGTGTPITRPVLNPGTATAAQVAQALIDLGLCT